MKPFHTFSSHKNDCKPWVRTPAKKERIRGLLEKNEVGEFQPYLHDTLLKELYWKNLLQKDKCGKRLIWRSDVLRLAARRIVGVG